MADLARETSFPLVDCFLFEAESSKLTRAGETELPIEVVRGVLELALLAPLAVGRRNDIAVLRQTFHVQQVEIGIRESGICKAAFAHNNWTNESVALGGYLWQGHTMAPHS